MTEVLSEAGLPTDAAFTVREHFNLTPGAKSLTEVHYILYGLFTVHQLLLLYCLVCEDLDLHTESVASFLLALYHTSTLLLL